MRAKKISLLYFWQILRAQGTEKVIKNKTLNFSSRYTGNLTQRNLT